MSREPHPFERLGSDHKGWNRYRFELDGRTWILLTIDDDRETRSQLWPEKPAIDRVWEHYNNMVLDGCVITVDAAVTIIRKAYVTRESGRVAGYKQAQADFRKAIGL